MKLVVCIVHNRYADLLEKGLKELDYRMTELASSGGFLRKGNTTFLFGVKNNEVDTLRNDMQRICVEAEKKKGKAKDVDSRYTSFVIDAKESFPILASLENGKK
ncbi:cyclic-di-AMP receptor [Alteribacter populi]|uniref:cyclic-di-AMP receptor n=1 Tax=Alteribacter populi TaxID=2011011 RepID=UPI000BBA7DB5|nr:cyclic-di-AMP receptor [Alteribacter populi]